MNGMCGYSLYFDILSGNKTALMSRLMQKLAYSLLNVLDNNKLCLFRLLLMDTIKICFVLLPATQIIYDADVSLVGPNR